MARVVEELPDDLEVVRTGGPGEATTIAREREPSVEAIYVLSGDGTYNEVLNGVAGTVPLGFLPGGGTSVLPRALGLGRDPVVAARMAARGATRRIGLGRVNGRRFSFNAGIGFDAELVRRIDAKGRRADGRRPGDLAFVRTAIGLVTSRRGSFPDALEIEGAGRAAFALVANCDPYTYAGRVPVRVARGASFDLGLDLVAPTSLRAREPASAPPGDVPRRPATTRSDRSPRRRPDRRPLRRADAAPGGRRGPWRRGACGVRDRAPRGHGSGSRSVATSIRAFAQRDTRRLRRQVLRRARGPKRSDQRLPIPFANCVSSMRKCSSSTFSSASSSRCRMAAIWRRCTSSVWRS